MNSLPRLAAASLVAAGLFGSTAQSATHRVTVAAADVDRAGQVVEFGLPAGAKNATVLKGPNGLTLPLQADGQGNARVVIPAQKAGEALAFTLGDGKVAGGVQVTNATKRLQIKVAGKPAFDYQMDRDALPRPDIKPELKRTGYIHPVYTPSGKIVTDDYPPDFWNVDTKKGTKSGAQDFAGLGRTWSGPVHGGFEARLQQVDFSAPKPVVALNETWLVTAYDVPVAAGVAPVRMFDLVITQTCATNDPLILPQYHYGSFGYRGAAEWNGPGQAALFLTSEGETDRIKGNDTRGRWCYLGGKLDGQIAGTAILGHPENFRAPQPMRLHPNMPYMSWVPQQLGEFAIEPGKPYVARFRFVAADGAPDRARLDAFWNGYARPAVVKVETAP
jgi:hypothetical protein